MNLAIQILIGFLEQNSTLVLSILVALFVLYSLLLILRPKGGSNAVKLSILGASAAWIFFMLMIPSMTMSSLSQLTYFTDWMMLTIMSTGYATLVAILLYPTVRILTHMKG